MTDKMIIDNFYTNPDDIRKWALQMPFFVRGSFPGLRTPSVADPLFTNLKGHFERLLDKKITYWPTDYNTSFQYTLGNHHSWVHHDGGTEYAAVVYLTPDAPPESGTCFYQHKHSKVFKHEEGNLDYNEFLQDQDDWEEIDRIDNVFNRCALYRGNHYHRSSLVGFGTNKWNARMFQTFFFSTSDHYKG